MHRETVERTVRAKEEGHGTDQGSSGTKLDIWKNILEQKVFFVFVRPQQESITLLTSPQD